MRAGAINPTPEQVAAIEEMAAQAGLPTYWDGNFFGFGQEEPPAQPVVPFAVSMRQGRLALLAAGLLDAVDAGIAGIVNPVERRAAQIDWEYATEIRRDSPLIASLGPALGLSEAQIDELFIAAAGIE